MSLRRVLFFFTILISIFIINNFIHSIYSLWQKNNLITRAKLQLEAERKENIKLKQNLAEVKKPDFIEGEIREKLFLGKQGEGIVILPTDYLKASDSGKKQQKQESNWRKWLDLFF